MTMNESTLVAVFSAAIVFAFSWRRFDQSKIKIFGHPAAVPPHHLTSRGRYVLWRWVYVLVMEVFFVVLAVAGPKEFASEFTTSRSLAAALLVSGAIPNLPWIAGIEARFRDFFHKRAKIPKAAIDLTTDLLKTAEEKDLAFDPVRREALRSRPRQGITLDFEASRGSIEGRWTRVAYLHAGLQEWARQDASLQEYMSSDESGWKQLAQSFEGVGSLVALYLAKPEIRALRPLNDLGTEIDQLTKRIFQFTSLALLVCEQSSKTRFERRRSLGLAGEVQAFLSADDYFVMAATIGGPIFVSLLAIALIMEAVTPVTPWGERNLPAVGGLDALKMALLTAGNHVGAILAVLALKGVLRNRWEIVRASDPVRDLLARPFRFYVLSAVVGYVGGFLVLVTLGALIPSTAEALDVRPAWLLWGLIPATTGFMSGFYIDTHPHHAKPHAEGLLMVGLMAALTFLIGLVVFHDPESPRRLLAIQMDQQLLFANSVFSGILTGAVIGAIFPRVYRRLIYHQADAPRARALRPVAQH